MKPTPYQKKLKEQENKIKDDYMRTRITDTEEVKKKLDEIALRLQNGE